MAVVVQVAVGCQVLRRGRGLKFEVRPVQIALADENYSNSMNWADAKSTCEGKAKVGSYSWHLPERAEWNNMLNVNGGYQALNGKIQTAGGAGLLEDFYWSSTEGGDGAYFVEFYEGSVSWHDNVKTYKQRVRACLAF